MNLDISKVLQAGVFLVAGMAMTFTWTRSPASAAANAAPRALDMQGEYHAVALTNGAVYVGRLDGYGTDNPTLTDVYYVHCEMKDGKEVSNLLVKRGKEWHAPDRMYLNRQHILLVEPVSPTSRVADLIRGNNQ